MFNRPHIDDVIFREGIIDAVNTYAFTMVSCVYIQLVRGRILSSNYLANRIIAGIVNDK